MLDTVLRWMPLEESVTVETVVVVIWEFPVLPDIPLPVPVGLFENPVFTVVAVVVVVDVTPTTVFVGTLVSMPPEPAVEPV